MEFFNDDEGWSYQWVDKSNSLNISYKKRNQGYIDWELIGDHNASNALGAIAAANHIGIPASKSIEALRLFRGVKRRLEKIGEYKDNIKIFDDFAHHPTAIKTTLEGLRNKIGNNRILAIIEPRSNTMKLGKMKEDLLKSLQEADIIFCFSKHLSWDPKILFKNIPNATVITDIERLADKISISCRPSDNIIFMSNGGFSGLQNKVAQLLKK